MNDIIDSIQLKAILEKLENGEHLYFNECEIFMNYIGTFWIRRNLRKEELEGFDDTEGWHQEYCETLEEALEKIGFTVQNQIRMF